MDEIATPSAKTFLSPSRPSALPHRVQRKDLAAAFRWAARLNLHEAVANHFSLAVDGGGRQFLMNPNQRHFSLIRASELQLLDADDRTTMVREDAPDWSAWSLHGAIHRQCAHARCVMHLHPIFSTVLAGLADSTLLPIDQNTATFFERVIIDDGFGGLATDSEGERCAQLLTDPTKNVLLMGNHGVLILGDSVADAFNRLVYFERAAETYVRALQTGRTLRVLSDDIAQKTALEIEAYPEQAVRHFDELKAILDKEGDDYAD